MAPLPALGLRSRFWQSACGDGPGQSATTLPPFTAPLRPDRWSLTSGRETRVSYCELQARAGATDTGTGRELRHDQAINARISAKLTGKLDYNTVREPIRARIKRRMTLAKTGTSKTAAKKAPVKKAAAKKPAARKPAAKKAAPKKK